MSELQKYTWTDNPEFCSGLIDMCATIPLYRVAGTPGKCPGGLEVANHIKKCIPLFHSPAGCAFQRKIHPFHQWELSYDIPCSGMTEMDTVYGGNDRLFNAIKAVADKYQPELIMVISTCTPDLIGDDFESVLNDVRREIPCEVVFTNGYTRLPTAGVRDALYSIIDQIVPQPSEKNQHSVNICTLPWGFSLFRIEEIKSLLEAIGVNINGIYFTDSTIDEIKQFSRAEANITDGRRVWCDLAEKKFGMKTITLQDANFNLSRFESLDYRPGMISGTVYFLQRVARELSLGDAAFEAVERMRIQIENDLSTWKKILKGKRISMPLFHSLGPLMIKELDMECGLVFVKFPKQTLLKTDAIEHEIKDHIAYIRKYQRKEPVILYDPTIEEEIEEIRQQSIDLAVNPTNFSIYRERGIRIFNDHTFIRHNVPLLGFSFILKLAEELDKIFKEPIPQGSLLLSLLDYSYSKDYPYLTEYWAKIADSFQTVWNCDMCDAFSGGNKDD